MSDCGGSVVDEWVRETTAADRVEAVVMSVQGPRPVSWIANAARVPAAEIDGVVDELVTNGVLTVVGDAAGDRVVRSSKDGVAASTVRLDVVESAFEKHWEDR